MSKYNITINNNVIEEYDKQWVKIGKLNISNIIGLKGKIGLYKMSINGKVIYIGKATESYNGTKGLYKRLNNYINQKGKSKAHQYIYKNQNNIDVEIINFGTGVEARAMANGLESLFIDYYAPTKNNHK